MKQKFSLLFGLLLSLFITSGFNTKDLQKSNSTTNSYLVQPELSGNWLIHSYGRGDAEMADAYQSFFFSFNPDGSILTSNGEESFKGNYYSDKESITFEFLENAALTELNGRWQREVQNEDEIVLQREDGYHLVFRQVYFGQ